MKIRQKRASQRTVALRCLLYRNYRFGGRRRDFDNLLCWAAPAQHRSITDEQHPMCRGSARTNRNNVRDMNNLRQSPAILYCAPFSGCSGGLAAEQCSARAQVHSTRRSANACRAASNTAIRVPQHIHKGLCIVISFLRISINKFPLIKRNPLQIETDSDSSRPRRNTNNASSAPAGTQHQ